MKKIREYLAWKFFCFLMPTQKKEESMFDRLGECKGYSVGGSWLPRFKDCPPPPEKIVRGNAQELFAKRLIEIYNEFPDRKKYPLNTILLTKDGRMYGNAIVVGHHKLMVEGGGYSTEYYNKIKTDYGHETFLSDSEVDACFHRASICEIELYYDSVSNHKHYAKPPYHK